MQEIRVQHYSYHTNNTHKKGYFRSDIPKEKIRCKLAQVSKALKEKGFIQSLREKTSKEQAHRLFYKIAIKKLSFEINIFVSNSSKVIKINSSLKKVVLRVGSECDTLILLNELRNEVNQRIRGLTAERNYISLLRRRLGQAHSRVISIKKSNAEDDKHGIDLYVTWHLDDREWFDVPIEVKTTIEGFEEHIHKNPDIPAILLNETQSEDEVIEKTLSLCMAYVYEDKVLHLAA